jgi:hypothetical protein
VPAAQKNRGKSADLARWPSSGRHGAVELLYAYGMVVPFSGIPAIAFYYFGQEYKKYTPTLSVPHGRIYLFLCYFIEKNQDE